MAVTWDIDVSNVNTITGRADLTFVRTDDASTAEPRSYTFRNTPIGTSGDRVLLLNTVKTMDEAAVIAESDKHAVLSDLVQAGIANLNNWELTR